MCRWNTRATCAFDFIGIAGTLDMTTVQSIIDCLDPFTPP